MECRPLSVVSWINAEASQKMNRSFLLLLAALVSIGPVSSASFYKPIAGASQKTRPKLSAIFQDATENSGPEARYEPTSTLTLNSEERDQLRQAFLDTMRERRVTATMPPKTSTTTKFNRFSRLRTAPRTTRTSTIATANIRSEYVPSSLKTLRSPPFLQKRIKRQELGSTTIKTEM